MTDIRRTILWVVFVFSLIMLWDRWQIHNGKPATFFPDPQAQQQAAQLAASQPSPEPVTGVPSSSLAQSNIVRPEGSIPNTGAAAPAAPVAAPAQSFDVENADMRLRFSAQGGRVVFAELKHFAAAGEKADSAKRMVLLDELAGERIYRAETGLTNIPGLNHLTLMAGEISQQANGNTVLRFTSPVVQGVQLVQSYTVPAKGYLIGVRHEVINHSEAGINPHLYLQLSRDGNRPDGDSRLYHTFTGPAFWTAEKKYQKVGFSDIKTIEDANAKFERQSEHGYVAMVQHYFTSAWLPDDAKQKQSVLRQNYASNLGNNLYAAGLKTDIAQIAPGQSAGFNSRLYIGPQNEKVLEQIYPGFEAVKDYGIFTILSKPLFLLMTILHKFIGNWGWTIVALVFLLKAALYWLNAKAYSSMAKMKSVTPRITEMRERLKDDPQQMQTEMMKIYREEKVNPLGGCLPMLIQIPIFIALYWVILSSVEFRGAPWLGWITDLSAKDPWLILPILMGLSSLLQVWLNPTPPDPMQAKLMWIMPIAFSVMFFFFPAGLVLYWLTNNILSIAQQWVINKRLGVI